MVLDPAPVSVLNEPYDKAVRQYNKECQEAALAEHAKKLAAAPRSLRFLRWLRRTLCCCFPPSLEELPPTFNPVQQLPENLYVGPDGTIIKGRMIPIG